MRENFCANQKREQKGAPLSCRTVYQLPLVHGLVEANLDPKHELMVLAGKIDWAAIDDVLALSYSKIGREAKPIRLMVGLHILKHKYNLSDEQVVARVAADLYFRAFCGLNAPLGSAEWREPLNASTLTRFRKRIRAEGMRKVEQIIAGQLIKDRKINSRSQIVDSTAMEKNIAFPTDMRLLDTGRRLLVRHLKQFKRLGCAIKLRRTYSRKARRLLIVQGKLARQGSKERLEKISKELICYAQDVLKQVSSALKSGNRRATTKEKAQIKRIKERLIEDAKNLERVIEQTEQKHQGVHVKGKVLSFREPHVAAIAKGKLNKSYEYGCKVSLSMDQNGFVVSHTEYAGNPNDVTNLDDAVTGWERTTGRLPDELGGDRGYATSQYSELVRKIPKLAIPPVANRKHPDEKKHYYRRLQKKRACIEPLISHLKTDHRMDRSRYRGFEGDQMNVTLAAIAWNCKKWARAA